MQKDQKESNHNMTSYEKQRHSNTQPKWSDSFQTIRVRSVISSVEAFWKEKKKDGRRPEGS